MIATQTMASPTPAYNLIHNYELGNDRLKELQSHITKPIVRRKLWRSLESKLSAFFKYMWVGILDDLRDPRIALITLHNGGYLDGDTRINRTRAFFGDFLVKSQMDKMVDYVNLV